MDVNDNAYFLSKRVSLKTIASKLAPTRAWRSISWAATQQPRQPLAQRGLLWIGKALQQTPIVRP
ncbi:hypothetical protein PS903_06199 [Pseudomonas fluorescens]|nr:hypothetical protein PS903_06199 [Pseudomonas fluorescens]